jgi:hypothetical protein
MSDASYYRRQAERAWRFSEAALRLDLQRQFAKIARDFNEIAQDLENGAVALRHPELLAQRWPNKRREG